MQISINKVHKGNKLQCIHTRKEYWYRNGVVENSVGEAYTSKQYQKFYAKALELKHHSTLFYDTLY
jgi:hypothetical protein